MGNETQDEAGATPSLVQLPYELDLSVYYMQPAWSPNGERIVIAECDWFYICGGPGFIGVANSDGSEHKRLTETSNVQHPTWSPDDAFIAYSAQTCRLCSPPSIFYVSTDGTRKGTIISNAYSPSWRPSPR